MIVDWRFFQNPQLLAALLSGLKETAVLTLLAAAGALLIGVLVGLAQVAGPRWLRAAARGYVLFLRNVPLLIQLFFWYFGLTIVLPAHSFPILRSENLGAVIAIYTISIVMGAFIAEVVRAGVEAVPIGQMEAAAASGLGQAQTYRYVIVPQLVPIVLPGLCNEFVNVLKSTAFAMTIGVTDLMWQAQEIESETFRGVETMTAVTVLYFALSSIIIGCFRGLERLFALPGRP